MADIKTAQPKPNLTELDERYKIAYAFKQRWLGLYADLYRLVIPDRDATNVLFNYQDQGKPTTQNVWDNTAVLAAYQRANDLHGLLIPEGRRWGSLAFNPETTSTAQQDEFRPILDAINEKIFWYIDQSNLARVVSSSNLDLVGGTAALWVESPSDTTPLEFISIPSIALFIEQSANDIIYDAWFLKNMTGRQVLEAFPEYRGNIYTNLQEAPNETYPVRYGQIRIEEGKFYIYCVLDADPCEVLWEKTLNYQKMIIYRDRVRPGEADGRGIGLDLLPTIRDLNEIVKLDRKALAYKVDPLIFVDSNVYFNPNSLRKISGAYIPTIPGQNPLRPMEMPTSPDVMERVQALQAVIEKAFQVDPLGDIGTPVQSATEVSIRENRAQRTSATDISRLINELPRQVYETAAKILNERKLFRTVQGIHTINFGNNKLRFNFSSPLVDIQKQNDYAAFVQFGQTIQQLFGEGAVMAAVNIAETSGWLSEQLNLPAKLFRTGKQIGDIIQKAGQMQAIQNAPQATPTTAAIQLPQLQSAGTAP